MLSEVGGLDRLVTEFVRVTDRRLPDHVFHKYSPELLQGGKTQAGTPVYIQLLGGQAEPLAENAQRAVELGAPGIDLNFGCPAKTVNRHDGGAVILRDPQRVFQLSRAVRQAVPAAVPVTVKVRLGFDRKDLRTEIAQAVREAGIEQLVVHARTKTEMYTPPAHWHCLREMAVPGLKLVANGEIWNVADYHKCVQQAGVSDVALGRGLVRDPLLARRIRSALGVQDLGATFVREQFAWRFYHWNQELRGATFAVARIKQLLRYWSREDAQATEWFNSVKILHNPKDIAEHLERWAAEALKHPLKSIDNRIDLQLEKTQDLFRHDAAGVSGSTHGIAQQI
jgi:tRNA-dihydrouridine synthase C